MNQRFRSDTAATLKRKLAHKIHETPHLGYCILTLDCTLVLLKLVSWAWCCLSVASVSECLLNQLFRTTFVRT